MQPYVLLHKEKNILCPWLTCPVYNCQKSWQAKHIDNRQSVLKRRMTSTLLTLFCRHHCSHYDHYYHDCHFVVIIMIAILMIFFVFLKSVEWSGLVYLGSTLKQKCRRHCDEMFMAALDNSSAASDKNFIKSNFRSNACLWIKSIEVSKTKMYNGP